MQIEIKNVKEAVDHMNSQLQEATKSLGTAAPFIIESLNGFSVSDLGNGSWIISLGQFFLIEEDYMAEFDNSTLGLEASVEKNSVKFISTAIAFEFNSAMQELGSFKLEP